MAVMLNLSVLDRRILDRGLDGKPVSVKLVVKRIGLAESRSNLQMVGRKLSATSRLEMVSRICPCYVIGPEGRTALEKALR